MGKREAILSREETMEAFKVQQECFINLLNDLIQKAKEKPEDKQKIMSIGYMKSQDELFLREGVSEKQVKESISAC